MNRCQRTGARLVAALMFAAAAGLAVTLATTASAQTMERSVPRDVLLGRMVVTTPPIILLNGQPDRLSPGARIRDLQNMQVLSGGLVNLNLPVVYKRDPSGLVHEVWILSTEEYAKLARINTGDPAGVTKFIELLAFLFGLRR